MKKSVKLLWILFGGGLAFFLLLILLINLRIIGHMPSIEELENPRTALASTVYAEDGTLMGKYLQVDRSNIDYKDISKNVINALLATEDRRFYEHSGIDAKGTLAIPFYLMIGKKRGSSTITQQLALNLQQDGEGKRRSRNTFVRAFQKLTEWVIAIKLERNFTKEEIITLYLNAVPFGDNIYGIRNAARTFFSKEPDRLAVEEAAVLVGMLKANYTYNPMRNPKAALDRRNVVLNQMVENNKISEAEGARLKALPIKLNYHKLDENNGYAPYFREVLRDEVKNALKELEKPDGGKYDIYKDGLKIYTTINPRMQEYAEEAVASHMPTLQKALMAQAKLKNGSIWKEHENVLEASMKASDRWKNMAEDGLSDKEIKATFYKKTQMKIFAWNSNRQKDTVMTPYDSIKYHRQMLQTAFMVMDPQTGEVRAWVGGIDFKTYKLDHANMRTKRQVGSTIKPLLYTQAMEERGFTPETEVIDQQQNFGNGQLVPATTKSCSGRTMTMASALAGSRNCATAFIMKQVGPKQFAEFLGRINIPTKVDPFPSIALGACDLSLFEMMWGYSIFGGRGFSTKPYFISRIEDRNGNVIKRFDYSVNRKEAVSEATAYNMARMMQGTVDFGTAAGLRSRLGALEMSGKTGTTNDNADGWFMGYTPQLLGGVWIGCDDRFIRIENNLGYGGRAAMPIWEKFFQKVYADKTLGIEKDAKFVQPADIQLHINSADDIPTTEQVEPGAEGVDQGVGEATDYNINHEYIGPESKPVVDEDKPVKKDTSNKKDEKKNVTDSKPIGSAEEQPKKKGFFKRLFGKKDKKD